MAFTTSWTCRTDLRNPSSHQGNTCCPVLVVLSQLGRDFGEIVDHL
jgi:hypothetical protein